MFDTKKGGKASLSRTLDVYNLQELSDEPDPHATLPFISHHTLNLTRDLNDANQTNHSESLFLISISNTDNSILMILHCLDNL